MTLNRFPSMLTNLIGSLHTAGAFASATIVGQPRRSKALDERRSKECSVVEVRVPGPLESLTGGKRVLSAEGLTVSDVLATLGDTYPGFRDRIIGDDGQIHRFVNVYLNDEDIRFLSGMDTAVQSNDVLAILPALAGGAEHSRPAPGEKAARPVKPERSPPEAPRGPRTGHFRAPPYRPPSFPYRAGSPSPRGEGGRGEWGDRAQRRARGPAPLARGERFPARNGAPTAGSPAAGRPRC